MRNSEELGLKIKNLCSFEVAEDIVFVAIKDEWRSEKKHGGVAGKAG